MGMLATHSGGEGVFKEVRDFVHSTISSTFDTIVPIAKVSGTINTQSKSSVITASAKERLPHNQSWIFVIIGHVATTMVVAQTSAPRNGKRIQIEAPMRLTIKSTASTLRGI